MPSTRTYEQTHPWLTFTLDLRKIPHSVWIALGEAQSKCEHISGVPLRPETAEELHQIYLAKGALATTAIEGNTLSEEEALGRVKGELRLPPSKEYLGQEIDNIIEACNITASRLLTGCQPSISLEEIKKYNEIVLNKLPLREEVTPGGLRNHSVGVGTYRAAPPADCEFLLNRFTEWLNKGLVPFDENEIAFNVIKAIVAHIYFAWIHPFADGNGRTARLIEFKILLSSGVPSPAAHLLTNHYNQTRQEYYRQLDLTSKSPDGPISFIKYAVQGYVDGLKEQLDKIRSQQFDVAWRNFVHDSFKDKNTGADIRRRHLVLDLSSNGKAVPISKINEISVRMAKSYGGKTKRTIIRDINYLEEAELIVRTKEGISANTKKILAFLPACRKG